MEINGMLRQERFKVPDCALLPPMEWRNLNAEEIYERLQKKTPENNAAFDKHLQKGVDDLADVFSEDGDETPVVDPDYQVDFGNNPEESVREKVVEAAVQYEKQRGKLPGNIAQIVEGFRAGKLHWKELLAQFVTSCFGGSRRWLPPNRRYVSSGLYLQSRRDAKLQAVLAIDTSGSTNRDLPQFAAELVNLLNTFGQYELKVICCDYAIQSVETYSADHPFNGEKIKFKGGGGTRFTPVFDYMKDNPSEAQILIYFTDGYGDKPQKPPYPVMWVITPNGKNHIPWGYEIKLEK
jgi:predicted metal-dependent peptidase